MKIKKIKQKFVIMCDECQIRVAYRAKDEAELQKMLTDTDFLETEYLCKKCYDALEE